MKKKDPPIVVSALIPCDKTTAWTAITEHKKMIKWYFDNIPDFKPEVGFETQFPVKSKKRIFTHVWKITDVQENEFISYTWQYPEYPGKSKVTFALASHGDATEVTIITEVLKDFPSETVPEFQRESCEGGWRYFIGRLGKYVGKKK